MSGTLPTNGVLELDDDPQAVLAEFCARQWCDGLPIVPPTEERVRAMLSGADRDASLGAMPPLWRQATLEKLAVNAVMAGCEPAYFPVIVAGAAGPGPATVVDDSSGASRLPRPGPSAVALMRGGRSAP